MPAGTVIVYFFTAADTAGASASNGPVTTESATGVAPTSPATVETMLPEAPGITVTVAEPSATSPETSAGAAMATGRTASGLRTVWPPPVQVRNPVA